jgi:hypothetical protein
MDIANKRVDWTKIGDANEKSTKTKKIALPKWTTRKSLQPRRSSPSPMRMRKGRRSGHATTDTQIRIIEKEENGGFCKISLIDAPSARNKRTEKTRAYSSYQQPDQESIARHYPSARHE